MLTLSILILVHVRTCDAPSKFYIFSYYECSDQGHEIAGEEGDRLTGGVEEMDIRQFVTEEPEVPSRVKREVPRLRRKEGGLPG